MEPLTTWKERLKNFTPPSMEPAIQVVLPKAPEYYARQVTLVNSKEDAEAMADLAKQRALSHIGFDTEFRYTSPGIPVGNKNEAQDPTSIQPLLLSLSMAEPPHRKKGGLYNFVVDLRQAEVLEAVQEILAQPVTFVCHSAKAELFCLFQLGLKEPRILWDSWVCERALSLGINHKRYSLKKGADEIDKMEADEKTREAVAFNNSLVSTCQRYSVSYRFEGVKKRLQKSFLTHTEDKPFTEEQIRYSAEDAIAVAQLYPRQVLSAMAAGILHHLKTVEMDWAVTNARIGWNGFRVDPQKRQKVQEACGRHHKDLKRRLQDEFGIENVNSHPQLVAYFEAEGVLQLFWKNGKFCFDKKQLKRLTDKHPAIPLVRALRRIRDLESNKILALELVGRDGRMHPEHFQLGAHTGRQTSRWPNVLGLERGLRPLVVPDEGCAIAEVDLSQIEIGVAAAVHGDENLIQMFNTGDVYSAMAQEFHCDRLDEEERRLTSADFKTRYKELRDQMKTCTLGLLYGITPVGIAEHLGTSAWEAAQVQERFIDMFPGIKRALCEAWGFGAIRGFAATVTGLRRWCPNQGQTTNWERNWLKNHPVQGSAAVVFKAAGNRLDRHYQAYGARIIIPLHDSFIFETPQETLEEVCELTKRVMCDTVREYFPELNPQVEANISRPDCWNKDGDADSLMRWLQDPLAEIKG